MNANTNTETARPSFRIVCAWCAPKAESIEENVSHGICPDCKAKLMAEIQTARE